MKDHEVTDTLYDEIVESEVAAILRYSANTAPCPDRCEHAHLKKVNSSGKDPHAYVSPLPLRKEHP